MAILKQVGNRLVREYDLEKLWIEPWGKNGLRVRATKHFQMEDQDWALLPSELWIEPWGKNGLRVRATKHFQMEDQDWALLPSDASAQIKIDGQTAEITNGKITAKIAASGKLTFWRADGKLLLEEYLRQESSDEFSSLLKIDGRETTVRGISSSGIL